ncbi:MAG: DoxX family protein [bacterium]
MTHAHSSFASPAVPSAKSRLWTGRVLTTIAILFLIFDGVGKLVKPAPVVDGFAQLGVPLHLSSLIGIILLACTALYAAPRTAIIGAILLTGFLGGAIAIQLRAESALFPDLFPLIFAAIIWGGLWLRDDRLRQLFAPR